MVDQFIAQEAYGWFRKLFFSKQKYVDRLYELIEETAAEFELFHPLLNGEVPFYHSKPLFEVLNNHLCI